jgi:hypothetical protein
MSLLTQSEKSVHKAAFEKSGKSSVQFSKKSRMKPSSAKRRKKFISRLNMWIRRIHLFSGLFMLPWVLLYGFTALLFNHPTYMTDSKTEIENFSLPVEQSELLPAANMFAALAVDSAQATLQKDEGLQVVELASPTNAVFTRQISGSVENDEQSVSVILNLNNGKGYLRKRAKERKLEASVEVVEKGATKSKMASLEGGLNLLVKADPVKSLKSGVSELLKSKDLNAEELSFRSVPNLDFDAIVDGQLVRLRLAQDRSRDVSRAAGTTGDGDKSGKQSSDKQPQPTYKSRLTIIGENPRDLSARSFLLRLHMAHGYGVQMNSRWFWAIAVDLMFASMCFWGLSGVVMWWQIKRTRRIGFVLLMASAIVAAWLAIGMHWQLVNG